MKAKKILKRIAKIEALIVESDGAIFSKCAPYPRTASRCEGCYLPCEEGCEFASILRDGEESPGEAFSANIKSHAGTLKTETEALGGWKESHFGSHEEKMGSETGGGGESWHQPWRRKRR